MKFSQKTDAKVNQDLDNKETILKHNITPVTTPGDEPNTFDENLHAPAVNRPLLDSRRNSNQDATTKITFLERNETKLFI